ncbi:DUF397 domain-containing protein [Nonomuraea sp. NPDC049649]|uniref:DUF397 domain-containing protein n=1 Tax=Nonomuraea sp. NPDC049649 TaxID=3155776 RepID=UPI00342158D6
MDKLTRELDTATWRKSTRSGPDGGNCVEVAELPGGRRGVRDSKTLNGPVLVFTSGEWAAFICGVKDGEFD